MRASPVAFVLLLVSSVARAEPDPAQLDYQRIERDFPLRPRQATLDDLDALAARFPESPAAARALLWRGQLALVDGDDRTAHDRFAALVRRFPSAPEIALAHRGLGDVASRGMHLDEAEREYAAALARVDPAQGAFRAELIEKRRRVAEAKQRRVAAWLAAGLLAAAASWLLARALRHRARVRFPSEVTYAFPVFAMLILGARFASDRRPLPTLAMTAIGSLGLIALSGLATEASPPRGRARFTHVFALVAGTLAVFYLAAYHGGLLDLIVETWRTGPE